MNGSRTQHLRTKFAAEYVGRSASTMEKLRVTGGGPTYSKVGRIVVYDIEELDAWLRSHRRASTSDKGQQREGIQQLILPITETFKVHD